MAKLQQTLVAQLTYAAPTAVIPVAVTDGSYSKIAQVRIIGQNDNVTAAVQVQVVVSRSASPLTSGSIVTEKCLARGDAFIGVFDMTAARTAVRSQFDPQSQVHNQDELFDSNIGAYLGLKVLGLESGKTVDIQVELTMEQVAQNVTTTGVYLAQAVRFQAIGT